MCSYNYAYTVLKFQSIKDFEDQRSIDNLKVSNTNINKILQAYVKDIQNLWPSNTNYNITCSVLQIKL